MEKCSYRGLFMLQNGAVQKLVHPSLPLAHKQCTEGTQAPAVRAAWPGAGAPPNGICRLHGALQSQP